MRPHTIPLAGVVHLALLTCIWAGDDSSGAGTRSITVRQAIQLALQNNLDVRIEQINPQIEDSRVNFALGDFDPSLTVNATYEDTRYPQNAQQFVATGGSAANRFVNTPRIFDENNVRLKASFEGKLTTGTSYELFSEANLLDNSINRQLPPSLFNPEYSTSTGIRLRQPLLRDAGKTVNLAQVRIAQANREMASYAWQAKVATSVGQVIKTYYQIAFAYSDLGVKSDAITLGETLKTENERRLELGTMGPIDVTQAGVAIATRQEEALSARSYLTEQQNALKLLILKDYEDAPQSYVTVDPIEDSAEIPPRDEIVRLALEHRPEYLQTLAQLKREKIRLVFAQNQLLPKLDLEATAALNGLDGTVFDSYGQAFHRQGPQWSAGLVFSVPLGNIQAKSSREIAKLQLEQALLSIKRTELQIALEVDTVLDRLRTGNQRVISVQESSRLLVKSLEEEQGRLSQGLSTSYNVLVAQRDLSSAKSRVLAARADLGITLVDLWLVTGTLLDRYGVQIEDSGFNKSSPPAAK